MGYWQSMFSLLMRLGDFLSCNTECSFISSYLIRAPFKRTRNGPISLMWSFSKFLNLSWSWTAVKAAFMSKCWGWEFYSRNFSWCFILSVVYTQIFRNLQIYFKNVTTHNICSILRLPLSLPKKEICCK